MAASLGEQPTPRASQKGHGQSSPWDRRLGPPKRVLPVTYPEDFALREGPATPGSELGRRLGGAAWRQTLCAEKGGSGDISTITQDDTDVLLCLRWAERAQRASVCVLGVASSLNMTLVG